MSLFFVEIKQVLWDDGGVFIGGNDGASLGFWTWGFLLGARGGGGEIAVFAVGNGGGLRCGGGFGGKVVRGNFDVVYEVVAEIDSCWKIGGAFHVAINYEADMVGSWADMYRCAEEPWVSRSKYDVSLGRLVAWSSTHTGCNLCFLFHWNIVPVT